MDYNFLKEVLQLVGALATLWAGLVLVRIGKRFSASEIPAPLTVEVADFKRARMWRDIVSLVVAVVGVGLVIGATISFLL